MQVHPQQISPGEPFDIFYFLRNPNDLTTYYVQAVIYDIRTGAVLGTVNLTQSPVNAHLFSVTTQSPADSSGIGRNIVAIASLYTDSGYTIKSTDYEEQEQYFLIRAQIPLLAGGGGVDYRKVREIVQEELATSIKSIPAAPEVPYDALFGAIGAMQREINRIPKEMPSVQPILDALQELKTQIANIPTEEPETVELKPVIDALSELQQSIAAARREIRDTAKGTIAAQEDSFQTLQEKILAKVETGIADVLGKQDLSIPFRAMFAPKTQQTQPADPTAALHALLSH